MTHYVIVGAGITGLAAAYRLTQIAPKAEITVIEADKRVGGKIDTRHTAGLAIEAGAESLLSRKPRGVGLCEALGIADQLIGRRPENRATFIKHGGRLYDLPEGLSGFIPTNLDALTDNPLFSDAGRARIAAEVDIPAKLDDEDESLEQFITRRFGDEAYVRLIEPLMSGIYGGKGSELSIMATFPNLRQLEKAHGSLLAGLTRPKPKPGKAASPYPPFVSFPNGLQTLIDALKKELDDAGVRFRLRHYVSGITRLADGRFQVETARSQVSPADGVLVTSASYVAAAMFQTEQPDLADALNRFSFGSSAQVTFAFHAAEIDHPLRGYGYIISREQPGEALACTWSSQKWVNRAPDGVRLLRVFLGRHGHGGDDITVFDDRELATIAANELKTTLGLDAVPIHTETTRWPNGMPQYKLGHLERVQAVDELVSGIKGIELAGASYRGVGVPNCIEDGERAAEALLAG